MGHELALSSAQCKKAVPRFDEAADLFRAHLPCDTKGLRKVYLQLALKYHPDKCEEEERTVATQLFQAIAAAYEALLSPEPGTRSEPVRRVKSALAAAAELGDVEELRRLLSTLPAASVNEPDDVGITPLMFAAAGGCVEAARVLVEHGAAIDALNPINWSVMLYAGLGNHADMVAWLVSTGGVVCEHDLILTAYTGNSESLCVMLAAYDSIGSVAGIRTNESGKTLLHLACEGLCFLKSSAEQHAACVRLLLKHRVPPDAVDPLGRTCLQDFVADRRWHTPQNFVAGRERRWQTKPFEASIPHMAVLEELCLAGASVSRQDAAGESAISLATAAGLSRVREVLLGFA